MEMAFNLSLSLLVFIIMLIYHKVTFNKTVKRIKKEIEEVRKGNERG